MIMFFILNVKKNMNFINKRPLTDEKYATTYNNYYEFGSSKNIWRSAQKLSTDPWKISIDGLVEKKIEIDFRDLLEKLGFDINRHPFPDHHNFLSSDIYYLDHLPIVMTEKDASKCKDFDNNKIWYLTIDADVNNKFIDNIDKRLKSILNNE